MLGPDVVDVHSDRLGEFNERVRDGPLGRSRER